MGEVVEFPLSVYKPSPEERRLAESSAFKIIAVPEQWCVDIQTENLNYYTECNILKQLAEKNFNDFLVADLKVAAFKRMSLWQRIFNWPY